MEKGESRGGRGGNAAGLFMFLLRCTWSARDTQAGMRAPRMRTLSLTRPRAAPCARPRGRRRAHVSLRQRCSSGTALGMARFRSRDVEIYDNA